jgi:hypothetical protein
LYWSADAAAFAAPSVEENAAVSIDDRIQAAADAIARRLHDKVVRLENEAKQLEAKLQQKRNELSSAQEAPKRRATFPGRDGAYIVCPSCWIERSQRAFLSSLPGDALQCRACNFKVVVVP